MVDAASWSWAVPCLKQKKKLKSVHPFLTKHELWTKILQNGTTTYKYLMSVTPKYHKCTKYLKFSPQFTVKLITVSYKMTAAYTYRAIKCYTLPFSNSQKLYNFNLTWNDF